MKLSPMMQQYFDIKEKYKDCILFYRVGDFYEMFYDDAHLASRELELTLTGKQCGQEERAPMCGVPYHAADTYIHRLVEKGHKVAICEQTEDPAFAKSLVARDVIRIVTPGTLTSETMLSENENNYLAALYYGSDGTSLAYCDISTGELAATEEPETSKALAGMTDVLVRLGVKEVILSRSFEEKYGASRVKDAVNAYTDVKDNDYFSRSAAEDILKAQFGKGAAGMMGLTGRTAAMSALGALLSYLLDTQKKSLSQLKPCTYFDTGCGMSLDKATLRNLEITETLYDKQLGGSLLGILDRTCTAMGARLLKKWLRGPLNNADEINRRLDAVGAAASDPLMENELRSSLKQVYDFERLAARIASGSVTGRDMLALKRSVSVLPDIKESLSMADAPLLADISEGIADLGDTAELIASSISEDAPFTVKEGGLIRDGFSPELDRLKASIKDAKEWIAMLEPRERERTGIKTLKVGYNKVFGYYIDVTRANAELVPDDYIRKQTLVNNERYITPELKETENLVMNAETKINKLEYEIFCEIREKVRARVRDIQDTSDAVAVLDVLCSFANVSNRYNYTRPEVDEGSELIIEGGRHPVIEQTDKAMFVSNDTYLNNSDSSLMIITGPNMSGKSTYMRQTALIVLMAQAGCFVPCTKARIGAVDRIFTRIGASDNLSQGQSTFYVEMSELSYILNFATERSLIILDEIGRGTSTYDGLSIAWACVDYLCSGRTHIRTLFATHYHELTDLEGELDGVKNLNVDVSEAAGEIVFLHKIVPGAASKSYGIHVARLAGIPKSLLDDAQSRLDALESGNMEIKRAAAPKKPGDGEQLSLFVPGPGEELVRKLRELDLMEVRPSQAIGILEELKERIK